MSEEILINGKKITELSDMFFEYCKLKKENEELKTYIQKMDKPEIKTIDSEIALKNIELQQENEKIKKQYNCYACDSCAGKEDYRNMKRHCENAIKTVHKYNNALKEIREQYIHRIFYKCDKTEEECPCHNCIILGQLDRVQNIVKIIDEVLNDRN